MTSKVRFDIGGEAFNSWLAETYAGSGFWHCVCVCGNRRRVHGTHLRQGISKTCGCQRLPAEPEKPAPPSRFYQPSWSSEPVRRRAGR